MLKKKLLPLVISAIAAIGIAAPVIKTNNNVSVCYADAPTEEDDFEFSQDFCRRAIDSFGNTINLDPSLRVDYFKQLIISTDNGLPLFESDNPVYSLDEIIPVLKTAFIYEITFAKYIINEIIPYKVAPNSTDEFKDTVSYYRDFLDKIIVNKESFINVFDYCDADEDLLIEDSDSVADFFDNIKNIYNALDEFLEESFETTSLNNYKKCYDDFKHKMMNPSEDELYYANGLSLFDDLISILTHLMSTNDYQNSFNELKNALRENFFTPGFTFSNDDINEFYQEIDDFDSLSEEQKAEFFSNHRTDLFMSVIRLGAFVDGLIYYDYYYSTKIDHYKCLINECPPVLYKMLDLFDALACKDYDNSFVLSMEVAEDIDLLLKDKFDNDDTDDDDLYEITLDKVVAGSKVFFYAEKGKDKYRMYGAQMACDMIASTTCDIEHKDEYLAKLNETVNFAMNLLSTHINSTLSTEFLPELTISNGLMGFFYNDYDSSALDILKTTPVDYDIGGTTTLSSTISEDGLELLMEKYNDDLELYTSWNYDLIYYPISLNNEITETCENISSYDLPMYSFYFSIPEGFAFADAYFINEYSNVETCSSHTTNWGFSDLNQIIIFDENEGGVANFSPEVNEVVIAFARASTSKKVENFYVNENNELVVVYGERDFYGHHKEEVIGLVKGDKGNTGDKGNDGKGIMSVAINENNELVVTYTDNTTFTVGKVVGDNGIPGDNGKTPYIGDNGNWFIDGEDTGVSATAKSNGVSIGLASGSGAIGIAALVVSLFKRKKVLTK